MKIKSVLLAIAIFMAFSLPVYAEAMPSVSAASAVLVNASTGNVVYEKNSLEVRAIASTTKIMTALLTLEAGELDVPFTVDSYAIRVEGTSMGLREGDIVTRRALCYGMLLPSGNDAANAAAVSVSGSISSFAEKMNKKAEELGMKMTHFVNPSGLDAEGHYSNAYDMALLTMQALKNSIFREICSTESISLEYGNPPYKRWLSNNNKLLWQYDGCIGVKTGFTDAARRCLVSAAERDGVSLIAVTLNAPNDWSDHARMFDYGFSVVKNQRVEIDLSNVYVNVVGGSSDRVRVRTDGEVLLPLSEEEMRYVTYKPNLYRFIYGGFNEGEAAGELIIYYDNKKIKTIPLVTAISSQAADNKIGFMLKIINSIRKFLS